MATAQETAYQIELAHARSAAPEIFNDESTAPSPESSVLSREERGEEGEEEEGEEEPTSITTQLRQSFRELRAARAAAATAEEDQEQDVVNSIIFEATYALLRPVWIDIFTTIGIASFGLSWLVLGAYTFVIDALNVFGFKKQEGALGALADPIDAAIGMRRAVSHDMPEFMKTSYRLMGRAFVIYPISFLVATIYGTLLVLIAIIVYAAFNPAEAIKLFGTSLI